MFRGWKPFAHLGDSGDFPEQWMSRICRKKSMEPIGVAGDNSDHVESFQFILDATERQAAVSHQLADVTSPSFDSE